MFFLILSYSYVSLFLFFLYISIIKNFQVNRFKFFIFNVCFLVSEIYISYKYLPTVTMDLYRYYEFLDSYKGISWETFQMYSLYKDTPLTSLYFYVIAQTGYPHLLPSISTGITIGIVMYVSSKLLYQNGNIFRGYALSVIGILSVASMIAITTGVRQNLAFSILAMAVYYDYFYEKKSNIVRILLYLLPCLIHTSAISIILVRIFVAITRFFPKLNYLLIAWPVLIGVLLTIQNSLPLVLQNAATRLLYYVEGYPLNLTLRVLSIFIYIMLFIILKINKDKRSSGKSYNRNDTFNNFYFAVLIFGIASYLAPHLFFRMLQFLMYISLPIFSDFFKKKSKYKLVIVFSMLIAFMLLMFYQDILPFWVIFKTRLI